MNLVKPNSNCFGCSPSNANGLQLSFRREMDEVWADVELDERFESYPGVIHGGIVATILDEAMGNVVRSDETSLSLTLSMRVRFSGLVKPRENYRVVGRVTSQKGIHFSVEARLLDSERRLVAAGEALFRKVAAADFADRLIVQQTKPDSSETAEHDKRQCGNYEDHCGGAGDRPGHDCA
jgi:acyl-coenzyme A thioesterase PaaI-like protein